MIVKLKMATTKSKHFQLYLLTLTNPTPSLRTDTCGGTDSTRTRKASGKFSNDKVFSHVLHLTSKMKNWLASC